MNYRCYGLTVSSDFPLPELLRQDGEATEAADLRISLGQVSSSGLPDGHVLDEHLHVSDRSLWLHVPDVATYLVEDGRQITLEPAPGADAASLRIYLLGSALGAILIQRGFLVLHGNAIQVGNQCLVCVGDSGIGKSTLTGAFLKRKHRVLADDVIPVDSNGHGIPGFPRIKLWQDAMERLGIETGTLQRVLPGMEKFNIPLSPVEFQLSPTPVRWVFVLEAGDVESICLTEIHGMEKLDPLYQNTYRVHFLETPGMKAIHLQQCAALASHIRLVRLTRPSQGIALDTLMDTILAWIAANP